MNEIFAPQGKLFCHLKRVLDWTKGKNVGPILAEINPVGFCSHKCYWCYCKHYHRPQVLKLEILESFLEDFKNLDGKAVNWAGGGEPALHPEIESILHVADSLDIEQGMFTNGSTLYKHAELFANKLRWIRISLDAASEETHELMHGVKDFTKIVDGIKAMVKLRAETRYDMDCYSDGKKFTIGICMSINTDNYHEIYPLCRDSKKWGVDYLQVRPILNVPGKKQLTANFWNKFVTPEIEKCYEMVEWDASDFQFLYTRYKFEELQAPGERLYKYCYGGQFVPVIDCNGDVVNCMYFLKDDNFILGNLYKDDFKNIWHSGWQKKIKEIELSRCQLNCKNNEINKFLYLAKHKPFIHRNFL